MTVQNVFFAGGGTGGHIYPALAIAQQILVIDPKVNIRFFCSDRKIDADILSKTTFDFIPLPAIGFSANPLRLLKFISATRKSRKIARNVIEAEMGSVMVGVGGFVSVGPVMAASDMGLPTFLVNTDSVPGKANKFLSRYADEIFVQFEHTRKYFPNRQDVVVTGCPLRADFAQPDKSRAIADLGIVPGKKVLLVTGASTGAKTINDAVTLLMDKLCRLQGWQIVHLTGKGEHEEVKKHYARCTMPHKVVDYYDNMAGLYACADLVIGRAGAVSVAEYAVSGVASILMPYPFHKDDHQALNAGELAKAGAAIVIKDAVNVDANAAQLWPHLESMMTTPANLEEMRTKSKALGKIDAAAQIAKKILSSYDPQV